MSIKFARFGMVCHTGAAWSRCLLPAKETDPELHRRRSYSSGVVGVTVNRYWSNEDKKSKLFSLLTSFYIFYFSLCELKKRKEKGKSNVDWFKEQWVE
jgi:hypothetical protein